MATKGNNVEINLMKNVKLLSKWGNLIVLTFSPLHSEIQYFLLETD